MQDSITIIIPTLTNAKGIISELKVLDKYPVVLIDNAPSKEKQLACKQHSSCTYLPQSINQGFARAINLALPFVKTNWICILNDDIEFKEKTLPFEQLIQIASKNNWDAVSPVLTKKTGEVENLGYRVLPMGRTELVFDPASHIDGITAACLIIKTSVFKSIGGFDGRFFAYLEDIDLFMRMSRAGYHFGVANKIKVIHNHMQTSGGMNNFKSTMDLKNWFFVIAKNWTFHDKIKYFPSIFVERLRNLSGFIKSTWKSYGYRSIYIVPKDLLWVLKELIAFPFKVKIQL